MHEGRLLVIVPHVIMHEGRLLVIVPHAIHEGGMFACKHPSEDKRIRGDHGCSHGTNEKNGYANYYRWELSIQ
ncbi:hypothetical protein AC249_AIPGENE13234 [Exaiptasia diaphana]|nr:hypothetical protein AC249_AIPGENE13234 [Exaiptasia diaphana]